MIYLTGDTHCGADMDKLDTIRLTSSDKLIIAGDFGLPFLPSDITEYEASNGEDGEYSNWIKYLREKPYTVLFIDGNHDNHDWWSEQEVSEMFGGKVQVHPHAPNVIHLMRGEVYTIEDRKIFTFGGAASTDRGWRIEGVSWWSKEEASDDEIENALENLARHDNKVDLIVTHTLPKSIIAQIPMFSRKLSPCRTADFLDEVLRRVNYKKWYCGHFHTDMDIPEQRVKVLYNDVVGITD